MKDSTKVAYQCMRDRTTCTGISCKKIHYTYVVALELPQLVDRQLSCLQEYESTSGSTKVHPYVEGTYSNKYGICHKLLQYGSTFVLSYFRTFHTVRKYSTLFYHTYKSTFWITFVHVDIFVHCTTTCTRTTPTTYPFQLFIFTFVSYHI